MRPNLKWAEVSEGCADGKSNREIEMMGCQYCGLVHGTLAESKQAEKRIGGKGR